MAMNYTSSGPTGGLTGGVAFNIMPSGAQNNFPATLTQVLFGNERVDIGNNVASSNFTAPVTGMYILATTIYLNHADTAADYIEAKILTSNRNYSIIWDMGGLSGDPVYWNFAMSVVADMDASDVAYVGITQGGSGTAQMDAEGTAANFSGCLIG